MAKIVVLGLPSEDWRDLTLGSLEIMKEAQNLWLKSASHPIAQYLQNKGITFNSFNNLSAEDSGQSNFDGKVVGKLVELANRVDKLTYVVPGAPFTDETVKLLLQSELDVEIEANSRQHTSSSYPLDSLVEVMETLRSPKGCPWDKKQTHQSLKRYLVEEAYEVAEAIEEENMNKICEELGDLLLQIVFHSQLAREQNSFNINNVINTVTEKMIRRHPHVFGELKVETAEDVEKTWADIKAGERAQKGEKELMDVPRGLPALIRAEKLQNRAARVGFQWEEVDGAISKLSEEIAELQEAIHRKGTEEQLEEMGDLLFAAVNVARYLGIDPEEALNETNRKFINRFSYIEKNAGKNLEDMNLQEMDILWEKAKKRENKQK